MKSKTLTKTKTNKKEEPAKSIALYLRVMGLKKNYITKANATAQALKSKKNH